MRPSQPPRAGGRGGLRAAALFLLALAVFWPATANDFTAYDDDAYVTRNVWVLEGLSPAGLRWALTTFHEANWHPLTWLSHQLDATLYGVRPFGHHLTSVLLHAAATALCFLFLRRATGAPGRSALAAALFAVHPLRVESVAWVAERKDVLCAFFWMLALLAHLAHARRPGPGRQAVLALFFALALLAKPMAVTLPFVLLLLDLWPLGRWLPPAIRGGGPAPGRTGFGALLLEKAPLFALSAAFAGVTLAAQHRYAAVGSLEVYPPAVRAANAVVSAALYLGQAAWPRDLAVVYPHPRALPPPAVLLGAAALLAAVTTAAARLVRRCPAAAFGWLWYVGTLAPVLGIVQAGAQAHADRYTYLPLAGIFTAVVWAVGSAVTRRGSARAAATAGALLLVPLALAARAQVGVWRDHRTLLEHAIAVVPDNWVAHLSLAMDLERRGDAAAAQRHYREVGRIKRDLPGGHLPQWRRAAGVAGGESPEAASPSEERLDDAGRAAWREGVAALRAGRFPEASERFAAVLRQHPEHAGALNNLGMALAGLGDLAGAARRFDEAARLAPGEPQPHVNAGNVRYARGDARGAAESYRRALELEPESAPSHANLGDALLALGERSEAMYEYREALRISPDHVRARRRLAEARGQDGAGPSAAGPQRGEALDYVLVP